jgi:hypothetical protein
MITTYYFTWWIEPIPLACMNDTIVIPFLEQHIITGFGVLYVLVFDNNSYFSSMDLVEFSLDKGIVLHHATNYYLEGNGVTKSINKNLILIIKKTFDDHHLNSHNPLCNALWVDQVIPKVALGT